MHVNRLELHDFRSYEQVVVEFEPGEQNAVFKKQADRKNQEWSARFEHAFSQIVDWFYSFEDQNNTAAFQNTFGTGASQDAEEES